MAEEFGGGGVVGDEVLDGVEEVWELAGFDCLMEKMEGGFESRGDWAGGCDGAEIWG